jgi:hypothetical protein
MKDTVFLATASGGPLLHKEYVFGCLDAAQRFCCTDGPMSPHIMQGLYVENNRNILTAKFVESGASHMLFVDTDIGWRAHHVGMLLEVNKDVVSGCYAYKNGTGNLVGAVTGNMCGDLVECSVVPGGFLLIKRSAILLLMSVFSDCIYAEEGIGVVPALWSAAFTPGEACHRDDVAFSKHCTDAGIKLWMHKGVKLMHFGEQGFAVG